MASPFAADTKCYNTIMQYDKSCGAVIINQNSVLLVYQQKGFWGFPKGHIEAGETEVETALREVQEETNLKIIIDPDSRFSFSYYIPHLNTQKEVVLFLAHLAPNSPPLSRQASEIAILEWAPLDEVEDKLTFPEWQNIWRQIHQKIASQ